MGSSAWRYKKVGHNLATKTTATRTDKSKEDHFPGGFQEIPSTC